MSKVRNRLTLKWGTLKSWEFHGEKAQKLLREYYRIGRNMSGILHKDTPRQKEIICELIDEVDGKIWLDWDGKAVSKKQAAKYVREYGNTS